MYWESHPRHVKDPSSLLRRSRLDPYTPNIAQFAVTAVIVKYRSCNIHKKYNDDDAAVDDDNDDKRLLIMTMMMMMMMMIMMMMIHLNSHLPKSSARNITMLGQPSAAWLVVKRTTNRYSAFIVLNIL